MNKEIIAKVDEICEIKRKMEVLKARTAELEAYFLQAAEKDTLNTKYKTVTYNGTAKNSVSVTNSVSVKVIQAELLRKIFGSDIVGTTVTYTMAKPISRMLSGIVLDKYDKTPVEEIFKNITDDVKVINLLKKKVKGASFESDKDNIAKLCKMSEDQAEEYAYFIAEAMCWDEFIKKLNATEHKDNVEDTIQKINAAIVATETPKIKVSL